MSRLYEGAGNCIKKTGNVGLRIHEHARMIAIDGAFPAADENTPAFPSVQQAR